MANCTFRKNVWHFDTWKLTIKFKKFRAAFGLINVTDVTIMWQMLNQCTHKIIGLMMERRRMGVDFQISYVDGHKNHFYVYISNWTDGRLRMGLHTFKSNDNWCWPLLCWSLLDQLDWCHKCQICPTACLIDNLIQHISIVRWPDWAYTNR